MSTFLKKLIVWTFYIIGGILCLGGVTAPLGFFFAACGYFLKRGFKIDVD